MIHIPTMRKAMLHASRLTKKEIAAIMEPVGISLEKMRLGCASVNHHCVLHTAVATAEVIEEQGVVKGLQSQWDDADKALQAIWIRARSTGQWQPPTLYAAELAAIAEAMELHEWQIAQLSASELHRAVRLLIARSQSAGKPVGKATLEELESQKCQPTPA